MISRTNSTNFGAAYLQFKPKAVDIKPVSIEIPEEPVLKKLNEIVSGPRSNWSAHLDELPTGTSLVPSIAVKPNSSNMFTAKIGDEVYFVAKESPKEEKNQKKTDTLHEMFMHIYNSAIERLPKH